MIASVFGLLFLFVSHFIGCYQNTQNIRLDESDSVIYKSRTYSIYSHSVVDSVYEGTANPARIPNDTTIISPVRIIPKGKTVVLNTSDLWHPVPEIKKYPTLHTNHPSINATYNLALDHLYRCSSGEYMRNAGEEGMWQAGYRRGEGYGVWTRDACYIGLWMGSFLDREVGRKTIEYVILDGIDNGEDGLALPAIAVWNHYLVTGDASIIQNTYINLKSKVDKIQYKKERKLGFAHSGSFIDSGPQPEAGGFPLSTNILYAESYKVMAQMGKMKNESPAKIDLWNRRYEDMKQTINGEFWNPDLGYYTLGPKGSESYQKGHWENLGQCLAIWPQWDYADQNRRISVLQNKDAFYNSYGFMDLSYPRTTKEEKSLHGLQVWIFTEVGEAAAMAREGRSDELLELLASVIRTATIHKTFQECVDWKTGEAWRYDGQLWHAMGYLSMIYYGVLGMEYRQSGLSFHNACVPKPFANLSISNFQYRQAILDIKVNQWGVYDHMLLDGQPVEIINPHLSGNHVIEIVMKSDSKEL